ncbi:MAG: hypothetical protein NZ693_11645, partial [Thermoflexales bacterium]|nr:hypothetical protein [Thermoflexales bacterium]
MTQAFLSLSDAGKNAAWRYIVGIALIVVFWLLGGFITSAISLSLGLVNPEAGIAGMGESPLALALSLLSFLPMLVMPFLVTRWLHGRPAGTLLGVARRVHWGRVGSGFMLWVVLYVLAALILTLAGVSRYEFNPDFGRTLPMVLVGLLLLPIQTSAEEVFFRGYLLQATGRLTR